MGTNSKNKVPSMSENGVLITVDKHGSISERHMITGYWL